MYKIFYCGQMCPHEMYACQKKLPVQGASLFGLRRFALLLYLYGTCLDHVSATDDGYVLAHRKVFELHLSVIL